MFNSLSSTSYVPSPAPTNRFPPLLSNPHPLPLTPQFMDEYDSELVGALEDLELEADKVELTGNDKRLLEVAVADFEENYEASHE